MRKHLELILLVFALCASTGVDKVSARDVKAFLATGTVAGDTAVTDTLRLPWAQAVRLDLDSLMKHSMLQTSQLGLMIYDLDADSMIYSHGERQLLRPASTMKLLTAIAAIDKLGGSHTFNTTLCYTGKVENGTLKGDIYCVGGFDPRFNSDDMNAFIESLDRMGVDTIRGNIYADRSMKDNVPLGKGWCWDDDNPVLSPLLVNGKDVFMQRFRGMLDRDSIVFSGYMREGVKPDSAVCVCMRFHTLDQILMRMIKESDNQYAEAMFYQLAASTGVRPATSDNAISVVKRLIDKVGLSSANYNVADGSGLSLYNYVSAELEVRLLRYAYDNGNIYTHLLPSLPIAGTDGTLKKRMKGAFVSGNVRAKTGTVMGVSSLAGYCVAPNGHNLCFSIINQGLMHDKNGRKFQDLVCDILCEPR